MEPQSPNPPPPPPSAPSAGAPPPPASWNQPAASTPPSAWSQQAPQQAPPPGWTQQAPPPGYGAPPPGYVAAPGYAPAPGMMWVPVKQPVTPLAKIGALFLALFAILIGLFGGLLVVGGAVFSTATNSTDIPTFGRVVGGVIVFFGIVILLVAILQLLTGIFAWRGAGVARVLGVIFGLLFGLITLAGAAGGGTDPNTGASTSGGIGAWAVAIAYLYTAVVFIVAWKRK